MGWIISRDGLANAEKRSTQFVSSGRNQAALPKLTDAFLTLSVDDGHPADLRMAELMASLGLQATFYVPARNCERAVMKPSEIREISQAFEIGSHTMNHRRVHRLSDSEARAEIVNGKKWLEDVLSREVISFCYPGGKFNERSSRIVAGAGFIGARTCQRNIHTAPADPFHWGVSTQAYSHGLMTTLGRTNFAGAINHFRVSRFAHDWEKHFIRTLDWVQARSGIAHLYIHSWETENLGEWNKLKRVLANAAAREGLIRASNGMLFSLWHQWKEQAEKVRIPSSFR